MDDLHLGVWYKDGDLTTEDINCDSKYMLQIMSKVGNAIHESFFGVPRENCVYCVLDSTDGHGTEVVIEEYKRDSF